MKLIAGAWNRIGTRGAKDAVVYVSTRFFWVRRVVRFSRRFTRKRTLRDFSVSIFPDLNVDEALKAVERDALFLDIYLPDEYLNDILAYAKTHQCLANASVYEAANGGKKRLFYHPDYEKTERETGEVIVKGLYENAALCAAIDKIQNDPKLLEIASRYLHGDPKSNKAYLWWSFATQATTKQRLAAKQTVLFHYDLESYCFIYFNFYITEVDMTAGPHVAIKGSHKGKRLAHLFSSANQSDENIERRYGKENTLTICGKAGYGFIEDSYCYHKALAPTHKHRLLLQVRMT